MGAVKDDQALRQRYRPANPRSAAKELAALDRHCRRFIELSPFVVLGTSGPSGQDVSPRGGPPGFVKIIDDRTLLIPDFPGNNRLDSLENVLRTDSVGLLFFVPGVDETLRVNGTAAIEVDPALAPMLAVDGKLPISLLRVRVQQAYLHCGKALMRSGLWNPAVQIDRSEMPSMGQMLKEQINSEAPAETQPEMIERYRQTLY